MYITLLRKLVIPSKYTKKYCAICERALNRASSRKEAKLLLGYVEGHHILPKSFGVGGNKDDNNICYLTLKEHRFCHILLVKMTNGKLKSKMSYAIHLLLKSQKSKNYSPRETSFTHNLISRGTSGKDHHNYGKKLSEFTRQKISKSLKENGNSSKGKKRSQEYTRKAIETRKANNENWHSTETKEKMSNSKKGKNNPRFGAKWLYKDGIRKSVPANLLDQHLNDGWYSKNHSNPSL